VAKRSDFNSRKDKTMLRRLVIAACVLIVPMGLLIAVGQGTAVAKMPTKAKGIANCRISSGTGTLSPGLTPLGSPGGVKINFTAALDNPCPNSSVTKPKGVTVTGGTVTGTGFYNSIAGGASSCTNFDGPDVVGTITVTVKWTTIGPPIANTKVVYKNNPATATGSPTDTITLLAPPGTALKSGSFTAPSSDNTTQLVTDLPAPPCGPGPFSTFNILGGFVLV
jgi:hypothetical protein